MLADYTSRQFNHRTKQGFCYYLRTSGMRGYNITFHTIKNLFELYAQKPEGIRSSYWWKKGAKKPRIAAIKAALELATSKRKKK